jgi:two-component system phosphate regulon sensor histidine kinase PhoR
MVYFCVGMTKRRVNISIALMIMAIAAIASFQLYWLIKSYREEKQNLSILANVLFRDAVLQTQAAKLSVLDTSLKGRFSGRVDAVRVINNLQTRRRDTRGKIDEQNKVIVTFDASNAGILTDSLAPAKMDTNVRARSFQRRGPGQTIIFDLTHGLDSLQELVTEKEVGKVFARLMSNEKIDVDYSISKRAEKPREDFPFKRSLTLENSNEVTIGFQKPFVFKLELGNGTSYLFRKLTPQILVSVLLVGLTVMSFVILLRNLIQQRKLTQLKNDFISNITHELKTPLATVSVAIEALKNFNALHDPERTKEYLDISANELQRLSMLVDKVLKLSMFEKQEIELKYEWFDLKQLIREIVGSMRLQFEKFQAKVDIQVPADEVNIKADRLHITSVIFNLLDNALKYAKAYPSVHVDLKEGQDGIELSVTDNGIGISPEFRDKIFEKFFRVPTGDKHNVKGYGLGLSYVNYVVQRHHGNIDVESQEGIGSRFIVKLPRS